MSPTEIRARAKVARSYLKAAQDLLTLGELEEAGANPIASDAILSGIAAADVICGAALGVRSTGESHTDAIALLKTVAPHGTAYARDLKRLLDAKSTVQYSPIIAAASLAANCVKWAERLVQATEDELRGIRPR